MKTIKVILVLAMVVVVGWMLARLVASKREAARQAEAQKLRISAGASKNYSPLEEALRAAASNESTELPEMTQDAPKQTPVESVPSPAPAPAPKKKEWQDPEARVALAFVGVVPEADQFWALAINNPDLSPKERQDLIEDLNEEGFPDPKNITADDLPLIINRIELIEELAPYAMDEVNAAAFQEAYKDLVNMVVRLAPQ